MEATPISALELCFGCACMQESGVDQYEALQAVRLETQLATPDQAFLAGGDVRIGDFILLVDSDTRVPQHCMLPVVTELLMSPNVAFTQHFTTPLQVLTCSLLRVVTQPKQGFCRVVSGHGDDPWQNSKSAKLAKLFVFEGKGGKAFKHACCGQACDFENISAVGWGGVQSNSCH